MEDKIKQGWFDKLFSSFSNDVKTTGLVLLTLSTLYFMRKSDNKEAANQQLQKEAQETKDKWVERVIDEVNKRQDPRFRTMENKIDTVKMVSDSSRRDIQSTTDRIRTVAGKVEKALKSK